MPGPRLTLAYEDERGFINSDVWFWSRYISLADYLKRFSGPFMCIVFSITKKCLHTNQPSQLYSLTGKIVGPRGITSIVYVKKLKLGRNLGYSIVNQHCLLQQKGSTLQTIVRSSIKSAELQKSSIYLRML